MGGSEQGHHLKAFIETIPHEVIKNRSCKNSQSFMAMRTPLP